MLIQQIIASLQPDVLCLQETNGFDSLDQRLLKTFGHKLQYPYHAFSACGTQGKNYSVATYTRFPITRFETLPGFRHAGLITAIDTPKAKVVVGNVLLSDKSDDERINELRIATNALESSESKIICGDHNMLSSWDSYATFLVKTFNEKQRTRFTKEDRLDFRAAQYLATVDYKDVAEITRTKDAWTVRTKMSTAEGHPNCARLDYFFVSPSLVNKVRSLQTLRTTHTDRASDHYPVLLTLE